MNIDDIRNLLKNTNKKIWVSVIKRNPDIHNFILELYPNNKLNESLFLIMNNTVPVLATCGNKCKFENGKYTKYCDKPTKPNKEFDNGYCEICNTHWKMNKNNKTKENCISAHGVEHHFQRNDVKTKITNKTLEKYGVEHNSKSNIVQEKRKKTFLKKYGVDSPFKSDLIKNKIKNTNIERYGTDNYSSTQECVDKRNNTMLKKYGVKNASQSNIFKYKQRLSATETRYNIIMSSLGNYTELFEKDDILYSTNETLLPYYCDKHGLFESSYKYKIKCNICYPLYISTVQSDILNYIKSIINTECIVNNRSVLDSMEIDLYFPEYNIGIEVNGMYWHRDVVCDKLYHQQKVLLCKSRGIKLIHIFEDEWYNKTEIIKNRLKNVFQISNKLYARKCKVREINSKESNEFVNNHHVQGSVNANINLGLFYNDLLVSVMTFKKSRFDKNIEYELIRYCSLNTVVGGAGKLLKYFEKIYKPNSLISYADMNWSSGNLYKKLGFSDEQITSPGYFYYDPRRKIRISREKCQKHKLVNMGFDSNSTEYQICTNVLGYYRIYNSGNLKYTKYYNE